MRRDGGSVFPAPAGTTGDPNWPSRGLDANEIARALISMPGPEYALQSEAGYIDARPLHRQFDKVLSQRTQLDIHTYGSEATVLPMDLQCPLRTRKLTGSQSFR